MRLGLILALTTLWACTGLRAAQPSHEIFDERTGNTLLVVPKPLVFARERTDVAAHERDYATVVAVEIDQSGKYSEYLLLYRWSTVDRRMSPPPDPLAGFVARWIGGSPAAGTCTAGPDNRGQHPVRIQQ